ncbi:GAF domain-containing protein [Piscinibacter aquaticus]|uniref:GAF domain-containing protein n=1 Tax=Piscinibacter aquaticus TaxID=392597 RepID=A0A5C6U4K9_9BURK|nr:GAF domain-containing protein [Piscinibacter aquaticus]
MHRAPRGGRWASTRDNPRFDARCAKDGPVASAPIPHDESERLRSLAKLEVLDSEPEREFDALVHAAALVCGVPISLISLIDADRQWFKANLGLPGVSETPREVAFCAHAILQDDIFEVPDATADPRFADNALVTGHPAIRFYAGAPLRLSDGAHAGTLCVIDRQPRRLDALQRELLGHWRPQPSRRWKDGGRCAPSANCATARCGPRPR